MDASSIITQVSRDDEQLNYIPQSDKVNQNEKKPRKSIFRSLFCCCFSEREPSPVGTNGTCITEEVPSFGNVTQTSNTTNSTRNLLPPISNRDVHKKCMVIDLDETLVHSSFKPISNADFIVPVEIDGTVHQVYVLKRPFVDEFLQKMGELYECVLFTASLAKYADPVANLLDKWNVFRARLFRESCVFHRGNYVKDLSKLGRDLHKVVIMDNSPASYIFHPDNAVPVSSWFDDMSDSELIDLIPFLDTLSKVDNVYTVLRNCNNPLNPQVSPSGGSIENRDTRGVVNNVSPPSVNGQMPQQSQGPITSVQSPKLSQFSPLHQQQQQQQSNGNQNLTSSNNSNNNEEEVSKDRDSVS